MESVPNVRPFSQPAKIVTLGPVTAVSFVADV
jgi:hypothetical protein